ncbi:MAG: hypothetical protein WCD79_21535 [Chthoniobacteraceae bacterium]
MLQRVIYFLLGCAVALTLCAMLLLWHAYDDSPHEHTVQESLESLQKAPVKIEDMTGIWHGKESWGITYIINRKSDGTFTTVIDRRQSDTGGQPYIVRCKGHWWVDDGLYAYYYSETSDPKWKDLRPWPFVISTFNKGELQYRVEEGCWATERKE